MGLVSFFSKGKSRDNSGLSKEDENKVNTLRDIRSLLKVMMLHFINHNEEVFDEKKISELMISVKEYNAHVKTSVLIFNHLDKTVAKKLNTFYLPENINYFKIKQKSAQSISSKIIEMNNSLNRFIQETKQRYRVQAQQEYKQSV